MKEIFLPRTDSNYLKDLENLLDKFKKIIEQGNALKEKKFFEQAEKIFNFCYERQKDNIKIFQSALQNENFVENGYIALLKAAIVCFKGLSPEKEDAQINLRINFLLELMQDRDPQKEIMQNIHPKLGTMIYLMMSSGSVNFLVKLIGTLEVKLSITCLQEAIKYYESVSNENKSEKSKLAQQMFEEVIKKIYINSSSDVLSDDLLEKSCAIIANASSYLGYEIKYTQTEEDLINAIVKHCSFKKQPGTCYDIVQNRLIGRKFIEVRCTDKDRVNLLDKAVETENPEIIKISLPLSIKCLTTEEKTKLIKVAFKTNNASLMIEVFKKVLKQQDTLEGLEKFFNNKQFAKQLHINLGNLGLDSQKISLCEAAIKNIYRPNQFRRWQDDIKRDDEYEYSKITEKTSIKPPLNRLPSPLGERKNNNQR